MCSVPGYDASGRVDDLAAEMNKQVTSIAIGKNLVGRHCGKTECEAGFFIQRLDPWGCMILNIFLLG